MCQQLRILVWLLWFKNFTVRKCHFVGSLIELILPIFSIVGILYIRSTLDVEPHHVTDPTYFPILTKRDLINDVPRSILHLYYKPQNPFTEKVMQNVGQCMTLPRNHLFGFRSEEDMLRSYEIQQANDLLISVLAIDFEDASMPRNLSESVSNKLSYKIRSSDPIPDKLYDFESKFFSKASDVLIDKIPIVTLQMCLNDEFIDRVVPADVAKPTVVIQKMLYPPYDDINPVELTIQKIIMISGGFIFFATIYLIPMYISGEKTSGVNTLLKMNGVKSYQNFFSWLVSGMCFGIIPVVVVTTSFYWNFRPEQKSFYHHSDCCIIGLALFINFIHIYAFCLHVASYFSKAWLAQGMATTLSMLVNIVVIQMEDNNVSDFVPFLGVIFPTAAAMRIFDELNKRENQLTGVKWGNIFEATHPTLTNTGSIGSIMLLSIAGIILHFLLALYFDAILPSKYGVQKSPLFFLKCFKRNKVCNSYKASDVQELDGRPKVFESVPDGTLIPGIQLRNLTKYFKCGYFKSCRVDAVRGVSLDFYKEQITALLGHNGAGKTTTFSILSGLTAPSTGTVSIDGKDITNNLDEIRSDLGVCPQENMMFPDLTVLQQLRLIGMLKRKNQTNEQLKEEVDDLLNKLNINEKRNVMAEKLSGGQKRRLCLGMALIGNASTLFLDEPTSGMDPETSRGTWNIILKYRKQKTIIITTQSMEEADVLGDRIAIMQSGQMKCYGTPMFLKKYYGHNFHQVTLSVAPWFDEAKIRSMVGSEATMDVAHYGKIVISIPFTDSLPKLLDDIESRKEELGITGVSVSMITLEQVFLKSAAEEEKEESKEPVDEVDGSAELIVKKNKYLKGSERTRQMIATLLMKKMIYFSRDKHLFLAMILGVILAVVLPVMFKIDNSKKASNYLLDLSTYNNPEVLIYSENETLGETYKKIIEDQSARGTFARTGASLSSDLLFRAKEDLTDYETRMIIASEFNSSLLANGLYSGKASLSAPITVNAMSNLVLKALAGDQYSIVAKIGDLPQSLIKNSKNIPLIRVEILRVICLFAAVFFHVVALFVKHPLLENNTKVKQLQQMTGVSSFMYWGTTFVIDYAFYMLLIVLSVFGIFLMDFSTQTPFTFAEFGALFLLFSLFGVSALLLAYVHSFIERRFHLVYSILSGVPLLLAFIAISLQEISSNMGQNKNSDLLQRRMFSLEPHISFLFGYMRIREITFENARCRGLSNLLNEISCNIENSKLGGVQSACCGMECRDGYCKNPLMYFGDFYEKSGIEEFVLYLIFTPLILVGILYLLEQQIFTKLRLKIQINKQHFKSHDKIQDDEVKKEENIVCQEINERARASDLDLNDENVFLAHRLKKFYGEVEAVKNVSFRVKKKECFGLLGVNGAGKSTTFRMLVGEEIPTSGILYRGKYNIKSHRKEYLAGLGYCPQTDALIPCFDAEEHLSLLARLRGVPNSEVEKEVGSWIDKLQLNEYKTKPSGSYSGGNKRRLNIAMALIGSPKMVLLDEPTTGVDPAARRSVWNVLQNCQASGQAIILTSHSMEECEALCNRLVIMVQGRLLCVGASQELKERFGAGFNITIKLKPGTTEGDFDGIKKEIESAFVCKLIDEHPGYLFYHVTNPKTTWVKMFGKLKDVHSEYDCIDDYTVSSSTLEQLFMQFARSEKSPTTSEISNQTCMI